MRYTLASAPALLRWQDSIGKRSALRLACQEADGVLYCFITRVHKTLLRRILQLSLITVFRRSLVRDGEVWHQGNLFNLSVQN